MKQLLVTMVFFGLLQGCARYSFTSPPATPVITISSPQVVVQSTYARLYKNPDSFSPVMAIAKKGAILPVQSRSLFREDRFQWYRVQKDEIEGWVLEKDVHLSLSLSAAEIYSYWLLQDSL